MSELLLPPGVRFKLNGGTGRRGANRQRTEGVFPLFTLDGGSGRLSFMKLRIILDNGIVEAL
jgi:hypothetical protein